ncbi:MAG: hypothetical protein K2N08_02725, partial [Muribaculaceae bacterium]|nr:hypothetical protein [Muribaculaceae bacterium]
IMPNYTKFLIILTIAIYVIGAIILFPIIFKFTTWDLSGIIATMIGIGFWFGALYFSVGFAITASANDIRRYKLKRAKEAEKIAEKTNKAADKKRAEELWDDFWKFDESM